MLKDKMDKLYVDASWNEMKEILDREMPVKGKKRPFLFWIYGLTGILLLLIISLNIYKEIKRPIVSELTKTSTKEITSINSSENLSHEIEEDNNDLQNKTSHITKKEPNQHFTQKSKIGLKRKSLVDHSKDYQSSSDQLLYQNRTINKRNNQNPINENSDILVLKKPIEISDVNNTGSPSGNRPPIALIPPVNTFLNPLKFNSLLVLNPPLKQTIPIRQNSKKRHEIALSNRMYDQLNVNGELSASMIFPSSNYWISVGLGFGMDQYDLSPGIDQISPRTLISNEVEPNRFAMAQEPSTASNIETITYNQDRTLYFSPQINIGSDLSNSFRFGLGYQPRIFTANQSQDQDNIVQEGDNGLQEGQGNNSGYSDLDLSADRIDHYLSAKLNYLISPKFRVGVVYLRQIDKSIKLKPVSENINLYDNILDKINRSEVRLGLSYLF